MKKISKKRRNKIIALALSFALSILLIFLIIIYLKHIDKEANKITEDTTYSYTVKKKINSNGGLFVANIEDDLKTYIKKHKNIDNITYNIDGEDFYFQVNIFNEKDNFSIEIYKIVDNSRNISARMTYKDIKKIEYKTDSITNSSILNIITEYDNNYMAITKDNYYFLGTDIDKVSYDGEHFYYYSYNDVYDELANANSCSYEVINQIEEFNYSDIYYTYGIVNFLKDYYQKLAPNNYTVWQYCEYLNNRLNEGN